ncbi:DUF6377 domain-containing protein [Paraflavisolibacter sp. H34]|uniref:DUF6377 domain-containing protein n=1 Tax=Huijunlia imazamoxiresistens TaxID=3127457 RepID=UPI003017D18C
MKWIFACLFLLFQSYAVWGADRDSLLGELNGAIREAETYDAQKLEKIGQLKQRYRQAQSLPARYDLALDLYEEYKVFTFDSAFVYAQTLEHLAGQLNDPARLAASRMRLAFIFLSAGLYKETDDHLDRIDLQQLPDSLKGTYYPLVGRFYYDLADYDNDRFLSPGYTRKGTAYMDSALAYLAPGSFDHYFYRGLKALKMGAVEKAFADYQVLYRQPGLTDRQLAVVTSTLGIIYLRKKDTDQAINYQIKAAIADIRSSTKETYATFNLAELLFGQGDFRNASVYIEKAIADASFYGARQRKVQVSSILPLIEARRIGHIESQQKLWIIYAAVVTFFLAVLGFLITVIIRQVNKLKTAKRLITEAHNNVRDANARLQEVNAALHQVNSELQEVNGRLLEANKIKEEYIGYFFNINTGFFQKLEKIKSAIEQKVAERKLEEIRFLVHNINVRKEKEDLQKSFDKIFLKLFPNFVEEFNSLFREEDQIRLKDNELLNTDLRIFALMRMGISENDKIAQILEYSINTIYAYKTKIKNRAIVPKEEFDRRVMAIKSL